MAKETKQILQDRITQLQKHTVGILETLTFVQQERDLLQQTNKQLMEILKISTVSFEQSAKAIDAAAHSIADAFDLLRRE